MATTQTKRFGSADFDLGITGKLEYRNYLARRHFRWFIKETMGNYEFNWHHRRNCKAFMDWYTGKTPFLIITEPPRHGKTQQFSIHGPAFIFGDNPDARVIACSYSASLATKNNRAIQRLMDSRRYGEIFPDTKLFGKNIRSLATRPLRNSEEFEIVGHRGTYRAAGIGGPITGTGADFLIIDDPIKNQEEADSEVHREKVWDWWNSTALTRLEKFGRVLVILTRWHEDDLAGRLIEQSKKDPTALQWSVLNFEAIREDMSDDLDPRVVGEPLWPQKYNLDRLTTIKNSVGPRWWNALYQQRPTALEGGIIKSSWIKYYKELPPVWHRLIQSWDATFKDNVGNDFVAGTVWGVYNDKAYMLPYLVNERMGFTKTCEAIAHTSLLYPQARRKLVEDKANGSAILDSLKRPGVYDEIDPKTGRQRVRPAITGLIPVDPGKIGGKAARLTACATEIQSGDVLFPDPSIFPQVGTVIDQLVKFPNAKYDDITDTVSQALNDIFGKGNVLDKMTRGD